MTSIWLSILTLAKHCKFVRRQGTNIYVCFYLFSQHLVDGTGHGTVTAGKSCGAVWLEQASLKEKVQLSVLSSRPLKFGPHLLYHNLVFEVHSQTSMMELHCLLKVR